MHNPKIQTTDTEKLLKAKNNGPRALSDSDKKRLVIEQVKVYLLTYIAYALIHFEREFWSLSKKKLKNDLKIYSSTELSHFDFAELIMYSIFLFICGMMGD